MRWAEECRLTQLSPSSTVAYSTSRTDLASDAEPTYLGLSLTTWLKAGIVSALMIALYWVVLRWLWDKSNPIYGEANWGHAICIPLIGLYYLYIHREELAATPVKPAWSGLAIQLLGIVMFGYGIWPGQNQFLQGVGMVVTVFGTVLLLTGWRVMRIAWFPILYLLCGIPWPGLVYSMIASPLQHLAARGAVLTLRVTGVEAHNYGTKIETMGEGGVLRTLNVAEACAGLRSLMTFITVGAAVAFLSNRPLWQKILITLSAIPIAIFCNVMRVAGQGLLDYYWSYEMSQGFAHTFVGVVMLIPAFFLIMLVGWVLDHLFIEETDAPTTLTATPRAAAGASGATGTSATPKLAAAAPAAAKGPLVIEVPRRSLTPPRPQSGNGPPPPAAGPTIIPPRPQPRPPRRDA
jgi:exosortase